MVPDSQRDRTTSPRHRLPARLPTRPVGRRGRGRSRRGRCDQAGIERGTVRSAAVGGGRDRRRHRPRQPLPRPRGGRPAVGARRLLGVDVDAGHRRPGFGGDPAADPARIRRARRRGGDVLAVVRGLSGVRPAGRGRGDPGPAARRRPSTWRPSPQRSPTGPRSHSSRTPTTRPGPSCRQPRSRPCSTPCPTPASSCSTRPTRSSSTTPGSPTRRRCSPTIPIW